MFRGLAASSLVLALALGGCAPSGDDPRNRWTEWRPATDDYVIRYPEPPWEIADMPPTGLRLRIQSNAMASGMFEGGPGKYELAVTTEPGTPASRVAAERAARVAAGDEVRAEPREIVTREGVAGMEVLTFDPDAVWARHWRVAYLPLDATRVLRLELRATPDLESAEVTELIRLVGVGPPGP